MSEIRYATASPSSANLAVPLIYSAGPEAFDYMLCHGDKQAQDFLHYAFQQGVGLFGCDNHEAVFQNGQLVAIGAFYSGQQFQSLSADFLAQVKHFYSSQQAAALLASLRHFAKQSPAPARGCQYVSNLAVIDSFRGRGIGTGLLLRQRQYAAAAGLQTMELDVAANNPKAKQLYTRLGMKVVAKRSFNGSPRTGLRLVPTVERMRSKV